MARWKRARRASRRKTASRRRRGRARSRAASSLMTKTQIAGHLAGKFEITKKQSVLILEELATLAAKQAKSGFVFSGVGKLAPVRTSKSATRQPLHVVRPASAAKIRRSLGISGSVTRSARMALEKADIPS